MFPSVAGDFQMRNLLLLIFLFCHIFVFLCLLSFFAFYGRISCIHCQMLCDLQINSSHKVRCMGKILDMITGWRIELGTWIIYQS